MKILQHSIARLACAAVLALILAPLTLAQTATTSSSEKPSGASLTKWEYCILSFRESEFEGKEDREYIVIRYLKADGVKKERIEHPRNLDPQYGRYNYAAKLDLLLTVMAKLGEDGWELAGEDRMAIGSSDHPKFVFKRPKQ